MRRAALFGVLAAVVAGPGSAAAGEIAFARKPAARVEGNLVRIEFAAASETDAAVAVVGPDGRVVRHLAAGTLGANAPPPFRPGLRQAIVWDRKDDRGRPAPAGCKVRVGLGLRAAYGGVLGWDGLSFGFIRGLAADGKGVLYVLGSVSNGATVTAIHRKGEYVRTVLPHPAELPADRLKGLDRLKRTDGRRVPLVTGPGNRIYPQTTWLPRQGIALSADGRLFLIGAADEKTPGWQKLIRLRVDGSIPEPFLGPPLWKKKRSSGCLAVAHDKRLFLTAGPLGAAVFRVDPNADRPPELFARLGASEGEWTPRGLAVDPFGRLYVADPEGGRVVIFDAAGKYLRSLAAEGAQLVAVHPTTGAIYVLSQSSNPIVKLGWITFSQLSRRLVKLAGLTAAEPGKELARIDIPEIRRGRVCLALDGSGRRPALWLTPDGRRLWRFDDLGARFTKAREVRSTGLRFPSQVTLDRTRDELYVKAAMDGRIERVDVQTAARKALPVAANDLYAGPDGFLYVTRGPKYPGGYYPQFIRRYDRDGKPVPFPGGLGAVRVETEKRGTYNSDSGRGLFVAPDGRIYLAGWDVYDAKGEPNAPGPVRVLVFSPKGKLLNPKVVYGLPQGSSGIGVDRRGNLYVGGAMKPRGEACPPWIAPSKAVPAAIKDLPWRGARAAPGWRGVNWYFAESGCLLKFPSAGGKVWWEAGEKMERPPHLDAPDSHWRLRMFKVAPVRVKGAEWSRFAISPQPQGNDSQTFGLPGGVHCVCRSMRLDLDGYGRVFVPDALAFCVRVFDSAGNEVTRIGAYGNADSRGPGSPVPAPEIGLADVRFLAASDDAVYLSDTGNRRVLKAVLCCEAEGTADIE